MAKYKVEPTLDALTDSEEAYLWIYENAPEAALGWYEGLLEAFYSLEKHPFRCPVAPEDFFFDEEIRHLIYGHYRILFTVTGKKVFILRVRHDARLHLKPENESEDN